MDALNKDKFMALINTEVVDLKVTTFNKIQHMMLTDGMDTLDTGVVVDNIINFYLDYSADVDALLKRYISYTSPGDTDMIDFLNDILN